MDQRPNPRAPGAGDDAVPHVTPEIAAEASVWIARLHGPDRSPQMERECREWQARSAAHRHAFERCTDVWEDIPRLTLIDAFAATASRGAAPGDAPRSSSKPVSVRWWPWALVAAAGIGIGGILFGTWRDAGAYATAVGEQQLVILADGTRMSLNTSTRVRVQADASTRLVTVQGGEALFEVAKDPLRPFIVRAAGAEVVAVGTAFAVRYTATASAGDSALAVTLIEGQVTVRPRSGAPSDAIAPAAPLAMKAGERFSLVEARGRTGAAATQQVDTPRIEQVMAWKRSEAMFDDTPLPDAVREMNRYTRTPIVLVGGDALAKRRVSGLFHTGDSGAFARAVATLLHLEVRERDGRLELSPPQ